MRQTKENKKRKYLAVSPIDKGTVIDHIPAGKSLKILDLLNLPDGEKVMLGIDFFSEKLGKKDIIKIDKKILSRKDLNEISLIAPCATINIIKNSKIIKKYNLKLPKIIRGFVKCPNSKCISYLEPHTLKTKFYIISEKPLKLKCHYCERQYKAEEITLI